MTWTFNADSEEMTEFQQIEMKEEKRSILDAESTGKYCPESKGRGGGGELGGVNLGLKALRRLRIKITRPA